MTHTNTCKSILVLMLLMFAINPPLRAGYVDDFGAYVQSPGQWQTEQWMMAGGVVTLTALAYGRDRAVYDYMQLHQGPLGDQVQALGNSWGQINGLGGLTLLGLYGLGSYYDKPQWQRLGYRGFEAVAFSGLTTVVLKAGFGRLRPYQSPGQPDQWGQGGESFPSGHTTAAFALSTVLAEGVDEPSWQRRVFFYSLGATTAYARMYGNNHWLSDTVLGASIGIATGLFVLRREELAGSSLLVYPTATGMGFVYLI